MDQIELKMKSFIAIFFLAALGASNAAVTFAGGCPNVNVVTDFDVSSYLGVWYEYGRYFTTFEEGSKCNSAQYTANSDGTVAVLNSQVASATGISASIAGTATLDDAASGVAKLTVAFPFATSPYWVLGTDYTNYAVAWTCVENTDAAGTITSDRSVFILSRERVPSSDVVSAAIGVLDANSIDSSILIYADQTSC